MKLAFLLLVVFLVSSSLAQQCTVISCRAEGEDCLSTPLNPSGPLQLNSTNVPLNETCQLDSFCFLNSSSAFGMCEKRPIIGEACQHSNCEQLPFQSVVCSNSSGSSVCVLGEGQALINDGCSNNSQCAGVLTVCMNGVCTGVSTGGMCNSTLDCEAGDYCTPNSTCQVKKGVGSKCIGMGRNGLDNEVCAIGTLCGVFGTCEMLFSLPENSSCINSDECDIGLFCKKSNISSTIVSPNNVSIHRNTSGICSVFPSTPITCNTSSDCSMLGMKPLVDCSCDPLGAGKICVVVDQRVLPVMYPPFTKAEWMRILACYEDNGCSFGSTAPNSCAEKFCPKETSCLLASMEVFGGQNSMQFDTGCRMKPNFTCEGIQNTTVTTTGVATTGVVNATVCSNQTCCNALANPNVQTGQGYLVFEPSCLMGGLNCVGDNGCSLCFNSNSTGVNTDNRPICPSDIPAQQGVIATVHSGAANVAGSIAMIVLATMIIFGSAH